MAFERYYQILLEWNERINLTRIVEPSEVAVKHFLDSLSVYPLLPPRARQLIDVGSGAGFPGLPLKLACPDLQVTLLESTGKKTAFLRHVITELGLTGIEVITLRAEEAGQQADQRQRYDVAVARAVSPLVVLAEYLLPLVKVGGVMIAQKGQPPTEELAAATYAIKLLGGQAATVQPLHVPHLEGERHGVVIKKIKPTPKAYPRRPGLPSKEPLGSEK